ncbi:hypothetical protein Ataiwa_35890 [Algoriphagus taiwanensis]|uniref:PKD domain-containing protein n=2 Tax=Algoriphagus taiwanensis TaxID=1445656 RepID=A0ABQ6Q5C6_9BACT|nr:hypothetical protein Ataiwa_35890 [Algoriphagus taiwanensis]
MKNWKTYLFLFTFLGFFLALLDSYGLIIQSSNLNISIWESKTKAKLDTLERRIARIQNVNQNGVEIQPIRQGFPYCEPFTGTEIERPNTKVGGAAQLTASSGQNNGVLQLTNLTTSGQLGYSFIDLPFSSTYGIKVSFEYFIYNPVNPLEPGDGISFFLYDGNIPASDFRIGGLGGSLGYSAHGFSGGSFTDYTSSPPLFNPENTNGFGGLLGGYLGIGFDVWGKFGNEYERRYGGFLRPNDYYASHGGIVQPRYPNSVIVRGPQIIQPGEERRNGMPKTYPFTGLYPAPFNSYGFVTGKVTHDDASALPDVTLGTGSLPKTPDYFVSPMFKLSSNGRVEDCNLEGYRKVFIDFKPIDPLNPSAGFLIDVDMLVNNGVSGPQLIPILNTTFNPSQQVPSTFKLGFAGATGSKQAFQEIRNVTVQVSNENQLTKPVTNELNASACVGEEEFFELDVDLNNLGAQIQCIQLYQSELEALSVQNQLDQIINVQNCESGICQIEVCKQERLTEATTLGEFEAFIFLENGVEVPKIKFKSFLGVSGTTTVWYTVTDNFGQISAPKPINVTINPIPKIDGSGSIIGPTCNGQNDGSISNVILKDLIPGYTFTWTDANGNVIPGPYPLSETVVGNYIEATVGVNGINLGKYFLTVNNPATNSACDDVFEFDVIDVRGTPVEVILDDQEVCFGTPVTFVPELEDPTDANNPRFIWWKDNNKTQPITNGLTEGPISYQIAAPGVLTITGLPQNGTPYEFFVEVEADPSQNLCATPVGNLKRVQVLVLPPLSISLVQNDDLCRAGTGSVTVNAVGGFPSKTYSLDGINFQASNSFSNLLPGDYTVFVNAGSNCIGEQDFTILGPAAPLGITLISQTNPSCGLENGEVSFEVAGGTPPYTFTLNGGSISPQLANGTYTIGGLNEAPTHIIEVIDSNSCNFTVNTAAFNAIPIPEFDANDDIVCFGETAFLSVQTIELSNASNLVYNWFDESGSPITSGTFSGITYSVDNITGDLSISGLPENSQPYQYSVVISGDNLCSNDPLTASVTVNPEPKLNTPVITDVACFGENTGSIEFTPVDPAEGANYQYSLDGGNTWQGPIFSGLSAGTYSVLVQNTLTGCVTSLDSLNISQAPEVSFTTEEKIDPACGLANGLMRFEFAGGVGPYALTISRNGSNLISETDVTSPYQIENLAPGDYEITLTDANGCPHIILESLINNTGIPITVDPMEDQICEGDIATLIPIVATTGNPSLKWYKDSGATEEIISSPTPDVNGIVYTINASTMQLEIEGLQPGNYTYYLVATGPGYCPNPPFFGRVEVLEPITADLQITDEICFDSDNGSITVLATGADGNFEYSINNGPFVPTNVFTDLTPGDYSIEVRSTGSNGCTFQTTGRVNGPNAPISINNPDLIRSSCGLDNGEVANLIISGGWGNYSVEWRRGSISGPIIPGSITGAQNLFEDIYYLIITDDKGCVASFDFTIEEMPDPVYVIPDVEICEGETVSLVPVNTVSGSAPTSFRWYKDSSKTEEVLPGSDPSNPGVEYTLDPVSGELTIVGLSGQDNPYVYYLNVECTDEMVPVEALVRAIPNPVFITEPVSCFGGNDGKILVDSGGSSKFLYSVNGASPIAELDLENLTFAAGSYTIQVSNEGFCLQSFTVEVIQPDLPLDVAPLVKTDPGCGADIGVIRTQITGGWAPYQIQIFFNGNLLDTRTEDGPEVTINNLAPGDYYLRITDAEGCSVVSDTQTLVYGPTLIEVQDSEICEGEVAVFTPNASPAPSGATFEWYKDQNLTVPIISSNTPDANGHTFQISSSGEMTVSGLDYTDSPQTYFVIITGGTSCPGDVKEVSVIINRNPVLAYSVANEVCFGDQGTISLQGSAGDGSFTYSLDGINFQNSGLFTVSPGVYTGYVMSGSGCVVSTPNIIVEGPSADLTASLNQKQDATCNLPDGQISVNISGGYGNYQVEILRNGQLFSTESFAGGLFTKTGLPSGDYTLSVLDSGGCRVSVPGNIEIENLPTPLFAEGDELCAGEIASVSASTSQTGINPIFTWYTNPDKTGQISSGTSNGVTYQINGDGTMTIEGLIGREEPYVYYVGISGPEVCDTPLVPVEITVNPIPNLRVSNPSIVCDPKETVDLTKFIEGFNPSIYDYQIYSPSGTLMRLDEIAQVDQSGNYQVQSSLKGANCWSQNQRILVLITDTELIPGFEYEADLGGGNFIPNSEAQILEPVNFIDISEGNIIIWNWDFGDGGSSNQQNPTHIYEKKGTYTITLTTIDEIGCIAQTQQVINVLDDYLVIVPNAFTPDGTKNQFFKPEFRGIASMEFYIFSTWGELIYQSETLEDRGWDGKVNGQNAQNGNYVYRVVYTSRSGERKQKSGVFILIR